MKKGFELSVNLLVAVILGIVAATIALSALNGNPTASAQTPAADVTLGCGIAQYINVSRNTLTNCEISSSDGAIALQGTSSHNIVEYNSITTANRGIWITDPSSTGNTVYGNTFSDVATGFTDGGTGTITTVP